MALIFKALAGVLATIALPAAAGAQGVISERNVSMQLARTIADAAMECATDGVGCRSRWSTAPARSRCCCAATARRRTAPSSPAARPTRRGPSGGRRSNGPSAAKPTLVGQRSLAEVIPLGGGMPIKVGDETIGAVGVSGTSGGQQGDEDCAKAAIAKVADQLK